MSQTTTIPEPNPTEFFHRAINAMVNFGWDLLARIRETPAGTTTHHLPKSWRHKQRAEHRISRTLEWILGLARVLAGDSFYLPPNTPNAPANQRPPNPPRANPATPPTTKPPTPESREHHRAAARLRYMRKVFATQPTNRIAARLARRLGLTQNSIWWPAPLLTIIQTPASWAARTFRQSSPPPQTPKKPPHPPAPQLAPDPTPIAYHQRE